MSGGFIHCVRMLVHLVELGDGVWLSPADTSAHDKHGCQRVLVKSTRFDR